MNQPAGETVALAEATTGADATRATAPRPAPRPPSAQVPLWWALLLAGAAAAVRLVLVTEPPRPDEVGYLLVAAQARRDGPFLYGDLWVDRPPLLVAFSRSLAPAHRWWAATRSSRCACAPQQSSVAA